ncbi:extracellular calcium-sensing receptor-like [Protopterus annectens]|uniref:extracellular calcium-sensing receptor-like n=1 Tax=Protopterus annectens TaxID=7888 RepID=UPI001CF9B1CF|nr:extracellular calcium-sensing receptor-like [Protopterus annectens]
MVPTLCATEPEMLQLFSGQQLPLTFRIRAYRFVRAIVYAVNEINQSFQILPNITLGFNIYDSCFLEIRAADSTLQLLSGRKQPVPNYICQSKPVLPAIVGDEAAEATIQMARLLGIYHFPQVSYGFSYYLMSDKLQFPSFLRMVPSDNIQAFGLSRLLKYFGWTWVGIIGTDNFHYQAGSTTLRNEILKTGGCIDFFERIPMNNYESRLLEVLEIIKKSSVKVIAVYTRAVHAISLMDEVARQNVTGKVWIGATSWSISPDLPTRIKETLNGTVGFALHRGDIPGFKEFLYNLHPSTSPDDIYIKTFWEEAFGCKWMQSANDSLITKENNIAIPCTGEEKLTELDPYLFDVINFRFTYCTYNAVYAVAHALHNMFSCKQEGTLPNGQCVDKANYKSWMLLHYLRKVRFQNTGGEEIYFDENGDPRSLYDILNWQMFPDGRSQSVQVGSFDYSASEGQQIKMNESSIIWTAAFTKTPVSVCSNSCLPGFWKAARRGQPICCFDCLPCSKGEFSNETDTMECLKCPEDHWPDSKREKCIPKVIEFLAFEDSLGTTLAAIPIFFAIVTAAVLCTFIMKQDTPIVKANNRELSYLLLIALIFCFLCSLIFIGKPTKINCMLRQPAFGIIFSLCVSSILGKTITVVIAFNATNPNSNLRKWIGAKTPVFIILGSLLVQVIICICWLSTFPSFPQNNMNSQESKIIIECNEGSIISFYTMLGYLGTLAAVSLVVAFFARKLPDSFNEAKFITFSMLVFGSVWLTFIPAYMSTQGKYMVAVEVFAIVSSSAGILGCIFIPKCYIVILRPEMNTREHLIGKGIQRNKT